MLFKVGLHFGHRLGGERKRDKRGERVYKAAGESVKNRQLHRQKQDAKSIHFLKVRGRGGEGREAANRQPEKRPVVFAEVINSRTCTKRLKEENGRIGMCA